MRIPRQTLWAAFVIVAYTSSASGADAFRLEASRLPSLPDPLGVAGPFVGVVNDSLVVAGGANFPDAPPWKGGKKVWHDKIYLLTETNSDWKVVGKLPHALGYGISISTADGMVCVGGSDAQRHYADCFQLNIGEGKVQIRPLPHLPVPLANAAGALLGETIYIAGGAELPGEQSASANLYALNLAATAKGWTKLAPCPGKPRILPVAASVSGDFFLAGGAALETTTGTVARVYLRDAWRFRPNSGWSRLADLPRACVAAPGPAPAAGGQFFVLGGDDGSARDFQPIDEHPGFTRTISAYDTAGDKWSEVGEWATPRVTTGVAYWRNRFVVPSGEMRPGVRTPEVWSFRFLR